MKKIALVDGYSFVFRAYHSLPGLLNLQNVPVGAVYGFVNMLIKLLSALEVSHVAVVFDAGGKNFRHQLFEKYKANRPPCPADLIPQFPLIRQAVEALSLVSIEKKGYEADDIIATLSKQACQEDYEVLIISSDKDLMQLVNEKVQMYDAMKNKLIGIAEVEEKFGLKPHMVLDILAITGDTADNIPGIKGIGPKTAIELLTQFGSLENMLQNTSQISSLRKQQLVCAGKEQAVLSKQLASLDSQVEIDYCLNDFALQKIDASKLLDFLTQHNFRSLIKQVQQQFSYTQKNSQDIELNFASNHENLLDLAHKHSLLALYQQHEQVFLLPFNVNNLNHPNVLTIFSYNLSDILQNQQLHELLNTKSIRKVFFTSKEFLHFWQKNFTCPLVFDDISLIYHLLNPALHKINPSNQEKLFPALAETYLTNNINGIDFKILTTQNSGQEFIKTTMVAICQLYALLQPQIMANQLNNTYFNYELPLLSVLASIENNGIKIDHLALHQLSAEFKKQIADLSLKIYDLAQSEFNIASPQQLAEILYHKLKLGEHLKHNNSTSAEVLEEIEHPIAKYVLEFRKINKLKNTYTDVLPTLVNPQTRRIHSTFCSTNTLTGRLASSNPNLQNIPNKTAEGKKIYNCFIAKQDCILLTADYSQIELRVLAHLANIDSLIDAFKQNLDIHRVTASQIFHLPPSQVSEEQRNKAKAINFGIIYGISSFGLAKQLNIGRHEASKYIASYFQTYQGIEQYIANTVADASKNGFVKTISGRKCFISDINIPDKIKQNQAKRQAINAPIQGSAADIIKKATILMQEKIIQHKMTSKIVLQIHDELVLEVAKEELEQIKILLVETMQTTFNLKVPLVVNIE